MDQNEVLGHIEVEHAHLSRLFEDLRQTFETVAENGVVTNEDALVTAAEDLEDALEEMLHHFEQEEQVLFVQIRERFPDMAGDIVGLVDTHELICSHTRWLQELLGGDRARLIAQMDQALVVIRDVASQVAGHTHAETRVYGEALSKLSPKDRRAMLEMLQGL